MSDFKVKSQERTLRSSFTILASKWLKTAVRKKVFFGLRHSLMALGHDQQQHPTVYSVAVIRGRVRAVAVTGETCDT